MAKHTPGPWHATRKLGYVSDAHNRVVAEMAPRPGFEANARLIAAAPMLLEMLEEARLQLEYVHEKHGYATTETILARIRHMLAPLSEAQP